MADEEIKMSEELDWNHELENPEDTQASTETQIDTGSPPKMQPQYLSMSCKIDTINHDLTQHIQRLGHEQGRLKADNYSLAELMSKVSETSERANETSQNAFLIGQAMQEQIKSVLQMV